MIIVKGVKAPKTCFLCPAHEWEDFGGKNYGYKCGYLRDGKFMSNVAARGTKRRDCPIIDVEEMEAKT